MDDVDNPYKIAREIRKKQFFERRKAVSEKEDVPVELIEHATVESPLEPRRSRRIGVKHDASDDTKLMGAINARDKIRADSKK